MTDRAYTIALSIILALVALVTCLLVLVALLLVTRSGPLISLPASSTPVIILPTPTLPAPTRSDLPQLRIPLPTRDASLSLATRIVVLPTSTPTVETIIATPTARPTQPKPTPTPGPSPTPTLPENIQYLPDGPVRPDTSRGCVGGAIFGFIRDVEGKPVEGIRVKVYNEYITDFSAPSKPVSAPDAGFYDFIINPRPASWNVVVVDGGGSPISPEVEVVRPEGVDICFFQVDWKAVR